MIALRLAEDGQIRFEAADVSVHDIDGGKPRIRYRQDGAEHELACDFIAGCDGFHGVCRPSIPAGVLTAYERAYPFAWLGILAQAPTTSEELVYSRHDDGFALYSMRSPEVTRLYLQCALDDDFTIWPDERIWEELHRRLETDDAWRIAEGPVVERLIAPLRSFVVEPMRYGRLYLAGDAAHIVPPTGAKGMNLAIADVRLLGRQTP